MRYAWVGLAIVLIDLLGKLLDAHGVSNDGLTIPLGFLQLRMFGMGGDAIPLSQPLVLNLGTGLMLLVPLIAVLLLLMLDRPLLMSYTLFGLGVQFLAGSGLAVAMTRIMIGGYATFVAHDAGGLTILLLSARHFMLLIGVGVLVADQVTRRNARRAPPPVLQLAPEVAIDLTALRRGDDNVHIDATLSPAFMRNTRSAVTLLVTNHLANLAGKGKQNQPYGQVLQAVRDGYTGMLRVAMNQVRPTGDNSRIDLLRLAVLIFIREQVRGALAEGIERRYEHNHGALHIAGEGRNSRHDAERLLAGRGTAFHQVCRQLFLLLDTQEKNSTSGASGLPASLSLPSLFSVPLLQAGSPEDDDVLMEYYPLLGRRRSDAYSFRRLDALFNEVFPPSLVVPCNNKSGSAPELEAGMTPSVIGVPENITLLLDMATTKEAMRMAQPRGDRATYRRLGDLMRYQRLQLASLRMALERAKLVTTVLAIYETPQLYSIYSGEYAPQLLINLVRSRQNPMRIWRRLRQRGGRTSDKPPLMPILQALHRVRSRSVRDISAVLLRFAEDFSAYRRDYILYLATQDAVNKVRLLYEEREIRTVRMNHRLYEFPTPDEVAVSAEAIAGHVILKADLRGSTELTEQLVRRQLNPATYLSKNFYDPLTTLTARYQGEKVFIEGDAMILMFLETADLHRERLAVAKACGLAVRLLEMVAVSNVRNISYDLPTLELGIGITYQPGSPTYVFDGATRIVISPAINRADRLSSSADGLRKHISIHRHAPRVAVFHAVSSGDDLTGKRVAHLIYNVNGIALEPAAFWQLVEELPLYRVVGVPEGMGDGELFATPWPSPAGKHYRLVIRRARICALNEAPVEMSDASLACYFEVIAVPALLAVLEQSQLGELLTVPSTPKSVSLP